GVAYFNAGEYKRAAAPLASAFAEDPDPALRRMLAMATFNSEAYDRTVQLLQSDFTRESEPALLYVYGVAMVRSGRAAEAESVFSRLLRLHSDRPELLVVLGQAQAEQGDYESAIA